MSDFQPPKVQTNFVDSRGLDLGEKLITKDYLLSVYPSLGPQIEVTPELWGWGRSTCFGTNDSINKSTPVTTFSGGTNWKQISVGYDAGAAIKTDGSLWVWGTDLSARLGINGGGNRLTPVTTFAGGNNWKQVSLGRISSFSYASSAIKTDGSLWVWGRGSNGRLGTNDVIDKSTPVTTFAGGNDWKQISFSGYGAAAIKTDGSLWVWGANSSGQLGTNDTTQRDTPVTTFAGGNDWKQVSYESNSASAIKTDGSLWVWGANSSGQLGINNTITKSTPVTTFAGGNDWKQVSSGNANTSAIKTDGSLWVWGSDFSARLGINGGGNKLTPVTTFAGGNNWKQVSMGQNSAAIKTDGSLWVWGANSSGQLGINNTITKSTPVTTFAGGNNWKYISSGGGAITSMIGIKSQDYI